MDKVELHQESIALKKQKLELERLRVQQELQRLKEYTPDAADG